MCDCLAMSEAKLPTPMRDDLVGQTGHPEAAIEQALDRLVGVLGAGVDET